MLESNWISITISNCCFMPYQHSAFHLQGYTLAFAHYILAQVHAESTGEEEYENFKILNAIKNEVGSPQHSIARRAPNSSKERPRKKQNENKYAARMVCSALVFVYCRNESVGVFVHIPTTRVDAEQRNSHGFGLPLQNTTSQRTHNTFRWTKKNKKKTSNEAKESWMAKIYSGVV